MTATSKNVLQRGLENIQDPFATFIRAQTTISWLLLAATVLALWWANSDYSSTYQNLTHTPVGFFLGDLTLQASLKYVINDGLMVIFFLLLGLEIKREVIAGDLARTEHRRMLLLCAAGGIVCPAAIYLAFNWSLDSDVGWGIPIATDTAFALGVLAIVRKQVPSGLLAFLVGLAIVDDIGAILVIAIFYAEDVSILFLSSAFTLFALMAVGNYAGIRHRYFYIILGIAAWWLMLKSGVHPTLAGVVIALTIPARAKLTSKNQLGRVKTIISSMQKETKPVDVLGSRVDHEHVMEVRDSAERASAPLRRWEDTLESPVALFILPLFVLSNAGVPISLNSFVESLQHPIGLGIISGLVLGKFIGISGACWLGLRYKIGCLPEGVNFQHVIGVSFIAGIGFTMSTFIATLGFDAQPDQLQSAKSSILVASLISAILGLLYIRFFATKKKTDRPE
jgi:NhaA family Na+:H+ antiporter